MEHLYAFEFDGSKDLSQWVVDASAKTSDHHQNENVASCEMSIAACQGILTELQGRAVPPRKLLGK